jgi:copper chaperone CopZ
MGATSPYVHHVNGRLRVRSPLLRRNGHRVNEWKASIETLPGVMMTTLNAVTGSIVIYYEPNVTGPEVLLSHLQEQKYIPPGVQLPVLVHQNPLMALDSDATRKLAKELAFVIAKKVAERTIGGLVAAVI